jgi:hypothetical protein
VETFVAWSAGGGSGTGLTGVGLVAVLPIAGSQTVAAWAQITPNPGVQLLGTTTNAQLALGKHWMYLADGTIIGSTTPGVAGSWLGNVPLTTLSETGVLPGGLPNNAYLSAIVSGGQYTQATAGGLTSLRIKYRQMYSINDATQI